MSNQIVLDLDDVQGDFLSYILRVLNAKTGRNMMPQDLTEFRYSLLFPEISETEMVEIFIEHKIIENLNALEGAAEATRILTAAGYEITVVTARSWHPRGMQVTGEWLESHGCIFKNLLISDFGANKSDYYRQISSKFALIVDDVSKNINQAIDSNMFEEVALITKPWNISDPRFVSGVDRHDSLLSATRELLLKKAA